MRKRIGLREMRAIGPGEMVWDLVVSEFGARRQKGEAISYFVYYRTEDSRQRWKTIGRYGSPWIPETARGEARRILGEVVRSRDPAGAKRAQPTVKTVAELCDACLADGEAGRALTRRGQSKKPSTLATDRGRVVRPAGLVRRPCVSAHSRRGRDATAFEEILAAHRQTRGAAGGDNAASLAAFLRQPRSRFSALGSDNCRARRVYGTDDHQPLRALRRCSAVGRSRRGGE